MIRKFEKNENGDRRDYVMADVAIEADFCLKVSGDSMKGARILDGDRVFIRKQDQVENGAIAAVVVNNDSEATLRRIHYNSEKRVLILKPANPAYEDLRAILNNTYLQEGQAMINTKEPKELNNTGKMVGEIFQEFNDMTLLELQHIYPVLKKDIESLGINEKVRTFVDGIAKYYMIKKGGAECNLLHR